MSEEEQQEGGVYVIEPLEISEESEPMDIDDVIENISQEEMENNEIENLDDLINNLAQSKY